MCTCVRRGNSAYIVSVYICIIVFLEKVWYKVNSPLKKRDGSYYVESCIYTDIYVLDRTNQEFWDVAARQNSWIKTDQEVGRQADRADMRWKSRLVFLSDFSLPPLWTHMFWSQTE
jgi:hypothetical protein